MTLAVIEDIRTSFNRDDFEGVTHEEFQTHLLFVDIPPKSTTFMGYINGWKQLVRAFNLARCRPDWMILFKDRIEELLGAEISKAEVKKLTTFDDELDEFLEMLNEVDLLWVYADADVEYQRKHSILERDLKEIANKKQGIYQQLLDNAMEKAGA